MRPDFCQKIYRSVFLIVIFISFSQLAYSQAGAKLSFSYKVDSVLIDGQFRYNINITVEEGSGPYSFYLCDKPLWLGGQILEQSVGISTSKFTFSNQTAYRDRVIMVKGLGPDEYNAVKITTNQKR